MLEIIPKPPAGRVGWPWTTQTPVATVDGILWPKISIVTPSFNQGTFIEETIRSVLLQNYPNLEYFIIDGGSTDGSLEIIKKYSPWISYWVSEKDNGQGHAVNKGFARATGETLAWLNSDDVYYPNALFSASRHMMATPGYVAYVGVCDRVAAKGQVLSTVEPRNLTAAGIANWYFEGFFYQPACFFRRDAFEEIGGINEAFQNALDIDLWLRLIGKGGFSAMAAKVAFAHIHEEMKTMKNVPLRDAETTALAILHGHRQAAVNRMAGFAKYYAQTQASERFLVNALMKRLWARLKLEIG